MLLDFSPQVALLDYCCMMEVENVRMDLQNNENCLIHRRFEAAVKVIKSLPPDGESM